MQYDIFISYASEDVAWAEKLETTLQAGGRTVFRDQTRIKTGKQWGPQLQEALDNSQHMVVFWSSNSQPSAWVAKEMSRFERNAELDTKEQHRLICINLEGQNVAYETYQNIDLTSAGVSPTDAAGIEPNLWNDVVARIRTAIDEDENVERIETVVLAMTKAEADPAQAGGLTTKQLDRIVTEFGLEPKDILDRYEATRLDWHPYGGTLKIKAVLDDVIAQVNKIAPGVQFAWRTVSDDFWLDQVTQKPTEVAARLANAKLSLVVVDAMSLQWPEIYQRAILLRDHLKTSASAWVFVPPKGAEPTLLKYRQVVQGWSAPLLNAYFNPPLGQRESFAPQLGVFCGDSAEIRRLLQTTIGEYLSRSEKVQRSPYTEYQGRPHGRG